VATLYKSHAVAFTLRHLSSGVVCRRNAAWPTEAALADRVEGLFDV
jgi:hypothetical protein